ncbi:DUF4382 domain-containing protein [Flavilitoribacter nigricans]|uniref:DUF4382 domain-containing protein n=1 Tax=Flavilitoribacter nigricans (strain ATCC 23147 / DSM 23189 / NBRC 102662 / NCIMB 1420 / SS-2) TaxID=1122177 RepID=A0A2D0NCA4_FLAN2|nr:DUF4382 domain-containing protein [Flavilitoribacter nigricans]PHN06117.1 hypothetical protein CRP01_14210 [Flavilitoribacter nigricans DSM 23189 = NBRC 102662]
MNARKLLYFLLVPLVLVSCDPEALIDETTTEIDAVTSLNIRLTDAPIELDEVNIDLQQVIIKGPEGSQEIPLETNAGIYNLLDLQNGIDALIANADLELGQLTEVRLVLGENNTVVVEGESFELKIPSGSQSGLKIKLCLDLTDTPQYDLILDFDAAQSVHQTGNGKYIMKPVIRVMNPDAQCADEDEEDEEEEDESGKVELPESVTEWLDENYEGYQFKAAADTLCDGTEIYAVTAMKGSEKIYLSFDLDGNFLQSAVKIDETELPEAVTTAIAEGYPDYTISNNKSYKIERADAAVWFKTRIKNDAGYLEVTYTEDGTLVCGTEVSDDDGDEDEDEDGEEEEEEEDEEITIDDLPEAVVDFLDENYTDYEFTIDAQTFCDGTEIYLLKGDNGSNTILLYFDLDWNLWQSATWFDEAELPTAILETLAVDYEDYKIMNNQTWEIVRADSSLWYRVYLKKNNSSEKIYVIYAEDGTFICQEE